MSTSTSTDQVQPVTRYSAVAIALHWVLGLTVLAMFGVGVYMADLPFSPLRLKLYNWHKWAGVTFLALSVLRLLWRLTHRPPALPGNVVKAMPSWQTKAYHATHQLLYVLFFAVPLIGWAYSSAAGFPIVLFGQMPLPDLLTVDKELAALIKPLHELSAFALVGLAGLHIAAALKHHWIDRDGLLPRMLPGRSGTFFWSNSVKLTSFLLPLAASVLTVATFPALAQQKLVPAQSEMSFVFKQMGVPVEGHFKKFDAQVSFDAAKLPASKVAFTVDIASATLGSRETDAELPKADWFNTAKFPQATFASSGFKALGGGKYEVAGKLSIKGQSRDVVVPVTMTQSGAVTMAVGAFPIKRLVFKIGENDWADTSMVADDVQVKFKLALSGVGKL